MISSMQLGPKVPKPREKWTTVKIVRYALGVLLKFIWVFEMENCYWLAPELQSFHINQDQL